MGFRLLLLLFLASLSAIWAQNVEDDVIIVNGTEAIASTDTNYICATIDWWPHDKCNYDQCPWGSSSVINLVSVKYFESIALQNLNLILATD